MGPGTRRPPDPPRHPDAAPHSPPPRSSHGPGASPAFAALCAAWIALRFLPAAAPDPALLATIHSVRIRPAPIDGLARVVLPEGLSPTEAALRADPELAALVGRLRGDVQAVNEDLVRAAVAEAARIELWPDGSASFRAGGGSVPFFDRAAERLTEARLEAESRPGRSLATVRSAIVDRLEAPREDWRLEDETRQRELLRASRRIEEALDGATAREREARDRFRTLAAAAARTAGGPFHRRGPLRIAEIVLAAALGATFSLARRPERRKATAWLAAAAGPTLACAVILAAEGTPLLPVDPLRGTSLAFLPAAWLIGWVVARRIVPAPGPAPGPHEPEAALRPASPRPAPIAREAGPATPPSPPSSPPRERPPADPARLPFFRRARRG